MAWALWFYPQNNDGLDKQGIASYRQVAEKIKDALSIFNAQKQTARTNSVDIDDLRARVFGDTVAR